MSNRGKDFIVEVSDPRFDKFFIDSTLISNRIYNIVNRKMIESKRTGLPFRKDYAIDISSIEKTHNLYFAYTYRPFVDFANEYVRINAMGSSANLNLDSSEKCISFNLTPVSNSHYINDIVAHVKISSVGTKNGTNNYRYCAYPGMRLFKDVTLTSNGVKFDEYNRDDVLFINGYEIPSEKRKAWDTIHGQQRLKTAESYVPANQTTSVLYYKNGPQTPKTIQPQLDMFIPLHLFFCGDPSNALMGDMKANANNVINITLTDINKIIQVINENGEIIPNGIKKVNMEISLYVNSISIFPLVYDTISGRITKTLIRSKRRQRKTITSPFGQVRLSELKFPVEYIYLGFRDPKNTEDFDRWFMFGRIEEVSQEDALYTPIAFFNKEFEICEIECVEATPTLTLESTIVTKLGLKGDTITLYEKTNNVFYNSYLPTRYKQTTQLATPNDMNMFIIPCNCLRPLDMEPAGYIPASVIKDINLHYELEDVSVENPVELVISARVMNFILRNGTSYELQYAL